MVLYMSRTKSSKKREDILDSANLLFLKHGFNAVSMDLIRTEANVSKNTLYSHFKNKNELFTTVISNHWKHDSTPQIHLQPDENFEETLKRFATTLLKYLYAKKTISLFRLLIAEAERFPDLAKSIIKDNKPPILNSFSNFLQESCRLNTDKADHAATCFFGLLKEDAFWHVLAGFRKPYSKNEITAHVNISVKIFINLLKKLEK